MTPTRRIAAAVAAMACAAALAACSAGGQDAAELTAAPTGSGTATKAPVAAETRTVDAPVGPVQSIVSPQPPATSTASGSSGSGGAAEPAGFAWSSRTPSGGDLGSSWRDGCPVGPSSLRWVSLTYYDMGGSVRTGTLIIHRDIESAARRAFSTLFGLRFPIESIRPVSEFDSDDDASMAVNNTSAFNCRYAVTNPPSTSWSNHAYGKAIDLNPRTNPYVLDGEVLPPNGAQYADRSQQHPGGLYTGGAALKAFTSNGFEWGGVWSDPDYQHLER